MKSIALYYKRDETEQSNHSEKSERDDSVEFHMNIWRVKKAHHLMLHSELYFDFAIKTTFRTKELCIYVPFEIENVGEEKVKDLGGCLNNKDIVSTIFNEDYQFNTQKNDCFCYVESTDNPKASFYIYQLGQSNIKAEAFHDNISDGTIIKMEINGSPDNESHNAESHNAEKKLYVRIRVKVKKKEQVAMTRYLSNDLLQAAFSKIDMYDIRINEMRGWIWVVWLYSLILYQQIRSLYCLDLSISIR